MPLSILQYHLLSPLSISPFIYSSACLSLPPLLYLALCIPTGVSPLYRSPVFPCYLSPSPFSFLSFSTSPSASISLCLFLFSHNLIDTLLSPSLISQYSPSAITSLTLSSSLPLHEPRTLYTLYHPRSLPHSLSCTFTSPSSFPLGYVSHSLSLISALFLSTLHITFDLIHPISPQSSHPSFSSLSSLRSLSICHSLYLPFALTPLSLVFIFPIN